MFERLHPSGRYEGTGMGLAIVRRAAERMGGATGLESDGQTGSRFWIELPQARREVVRACPASLSLGRAA
jgi:signal transduction histidine kinase